MSHANPDSHIAQGQTLQQARLRAGMSLEDVSARLHMPVRVLRALEAGNWASLGAPVFVRGQLRSYARLLGLDVEAVLAEAELLTPAEPVQLVSRSHVSSWERFINQLGMKTVYVVMTLGLVIPTWMALNRSPVPESELLAAQQLRLESANSGNMRNPVTASMTPLSKPVAAPTALLSFEFDGESWVQFHNAGGELLEKGLMKAGDSRQFSSSELGRVVLGNASQVRVLRAGQPVDISPWLRSNVARFAVSSDGSFAEGE
ncbi:MAG: helix-turn-helix domain-containing protein [Pseudomonadota bacterium]|nr:helix-turn-helix domain-containing protein [Pseudomonadota bacterium]